jgi:hypothetical protein
MWERGRHTQRDRKTERQTDRQRDRQRDRERETDTETDREKERKNEWDVTCISKLEEHTSILELKVIWKTINFKT